MQGPNNYGRVLGYLIPHLEMLQLNSDNVRSVEASSVHGFQRPCAYEARHSRRAAIFRDDWDVVSRLLKSFAMIFPWILPILINSWIEYVSYDYIQPLV